MSKIITNSIISLLALLCVFFGVKYYLADIQLQKVLNANKINANIITFNKLFLDKVISSKVKVSQEDRLKLENAVFATKDNDLIDGWHNFLESKTAEEAQSRVLILLNMFADKIIH